MSNINPNDPYNSNPQPEVQPQSQPAPQQMPLQSQPQQQVQQPVYNPQYNQTPPQPQYVPYTPAPVEQLGVGGWILTLFILSIPMVNLIMLFVWGFGQDSPRKNFARGYLVWTLISTVIAVIISIAYFVVIYSMFQSADFGGFFDSFMSEFGNYY